MRRAWRCSGPSIASPGSSGMASDTRLSHVTRAFVDRAPIDWNAVRARARNTSDRGLTESLQLLDRLRRSSSGRPASNRDSTATRAAVRVVTTLAAIQTSGALLVLALAMLGGDSVGGR